MSALAFVFLLACAYAHGLMLNTTEGIVEGSKAADGDYYAFHGIPYAEIVDGLNRFKAPIPAKPYTGVFIANNSNLICAQPSEGGLIGHENCLTISIFTKNVTTTKPVIVYLNAEDYTNSKAHSFSPKRLVEENVVFVTLNFRLSIFGFLCLGVPDAPGNAGLRDVVLGLKWIKSNIAKFGGDPNNVVLMGHASGAAIVDLITMIPQAKDLVHKAVALSGSALAPWAVAYYPGDYAEFLGEKLGLKSKSKEDLAKQIMGVDTAVLNSALMKYLHFKNNTPLFAPCIENVKLNPNDTLLADAPSNLLASGNYSQIPYIAAYTTKEGTFRASEAFSEKWLDAMNDSFTEFLPVDLRIAVTSDSQLKDIVYFVKEHYFGSRPINVSSSSSFDKYLEYQGDTQVVVPVIRGVKQRSLKSKAEVRLMEFGHIGTTKSNSLYDQTLNGVPHGGILNYLFDYDLKPSDETAQRSLVKRFVSFAYTGLPNAKNSSSNVTWPAVTPNNLNILSYSNNQTSNNTEAVMTNPYLPNVMFWEGILDRHYMPPMSVIYTGIYNNVTGSSVNILSSIFIVMLCQMLTRLL